MSSGLSSFDTAWEMIAKADDQPAEYFRWCLRVIEAHSRAEITFDDAARMIGYRADMRPFPGLEKSGDAQMVMTSAEDITDGCAYVGDPEALQRQWDSIADIVRRHT